MRNIFYLILALVMVTGCAQQGSIADLSQDTAAPMASYPIKGTPTTADAILIIDAADANRTKRAFLGDATYLGAQNGEIGDVVVWVDGGSCSNGTYTTQATCVAALETWTPVAAVPIAVPEDVSDLTDTTGVVPTDVGDLTDTGGLLGAGTLSDLSDWPTEVSATEVSYLNNLSGNIQTQINSITAGSVSILATDPSAPTEGQAWVNTVDGKFKVASSTGVYSTAALTYAAWDTTPTAFTFTDITEATTSTVYTSNGITVAGIDYPSAISVSGGTYSINSTETFTSTAGTVSLNDVVRARVTSSASASTAVNAVVTIGGVEDTYTVTTAAGGSAYLFEESFDVVGYDDTWTETGTPESDYNTSPAPLTGTYSLQADFGDYIEGDLGAGVDELYILFKFRFEGAPSNSSVPNFVQLNDNSSANLASLRFSTAQAIRAYHGGAYSSTANYLNDTTTYYLWVHWKSATSGESNGVISVREGTTGVYADSGVVADKTNGDQVGDARYIRFGQIGLDSNTNYLFDNIYISTSAIGDAPWE